MKPTNEMSVMTKINLGCGQQYREGWINCDVSPRVKADKYFDLEKFPYPLDSSIADEIVLFQVLEHLDHVPEVLDELWRILKPGGVVNIQVPYGKSDWTLQDPTHKHFFTEKSLDVFCLETHWYTAHKFKLLKAQLTVDSTTLRHKLRNMIPFRNVLRYFLFNMYDGLTFQIQKPTAANESK